jgi:adenylate kinase
MKPLIVGITLYLITSVVFAFAHPTGNEMKTQIVILLGPPGSGKGTQAAKIAAELNIPHISTGDLFRANLKAGTPLGMKVKGFLDSGKLVPDEIVVDMLKERVSKSDSQKGYLLDGFPRSIPQAEALDKYIGSHTDFVVINLQVPDETVIKRIEGRLSCPECGSIYNKYYSPSSKGTHCEKCNHELLQRSDDREEVVQERLREYKLQTEPLIDFYAKKENLIHIRGDRAPNEVYQEILTKIRIYPNS